GAPPSWLGKPLPARTVLAINVRFSVARGSRNQKRAPFAPRDSQPTVPPHRSTVMRQKYRPNPAFPPPSFALLSSANTRAGVVPGGRPGPSSSTAARTNAPSSSSRSVTFESRGVYRRAFSTKLLKIRFKRDSSPAIFQLLAESPLTLNAIAAPLASNTG